jgi:hypothetical protein
VEHNLTNLSTVGCRVVAQIDSRGCDRLEFMEDGQILEHVPRGTGIDYNCLRVEFNTNMVLCAAKDGTFVDIMRRMFCCNFLRKSRL